VDARLVVIAVTVAILAVGRHACAAATGTAAAAATGSNTGRAVGRAGAAQQGAGATGGGNRRHAQLQR